MLGLQHSLDQTLSVMCAICLCSVKVISTSHTISYKKDQPPFYPNTTGLQECKRVPYYSPIGCLDLTYRTVVLELDEEIVKLR